MNEKDRDADAWATPDDKQHGDWRKLPEVQAQLTRSEANGYLVPYWALSAYVLAPSEPVQTHADEMRCLSMDVLYLRRDRRRLTAEIKRLRAWILYAPFPSLDGITHHENCPHWQCCALRGDPAPEKK